MSRSPDRIQILIEPRDPSWLGNGEPNPTQREFGEYDRLAAELQSHTNARVEILEKWLVDAPRDTMLLVAYHIAMRQSLKVALEGWPEPRPLLLNVNYETVHSLAETGNPAGFVLAERFSRWKLRQDERILRQVYGPKALAPSLEPLLEPATTGATEHYCMYKSREPLMLPAVLALYIEKYWQSLSG